MGLPVYAALRSRCNDGSSTSSTESPASLNEVANFAAVRLLPEHGCPHTTIRGIMDGQSKGRALLQKERVVKGRLMC